ncbi:hypothetical protein SEA_FORZA_88 [Gordonia phage Forza]|uniref:Uncharacterized protein n=1 Tax=Gordonia phage Forza TaxID=2571247 RepID=A0A650F0K0_9CAUD|nr:hypothetical protein PP303_gp088 [Gordonia phage Forza]QEM41555.1 hypothetical protein SEA_BOOPY_88 [Gordonia phage Boopy]QGT55081.1 hypothetical protein SEA_FORZA_88 [Gordonia phage Forza]UXE04229.1 hypothetical protein SEA_BLUENGOLD_87 [Gordonia phage BlueNGold]WBF03869.1 hypothetical protein SEA_MAREELIH_86 [Gordonia phage Mareelih]
MARFLETFEVIQGDGSWSNGPQPIDLLSQGVDIDTYDICTPATPADPPEFSMGDDVEPFAIKGYIEVPTRCAPADVEKYLHDAMVDSAEYTITKTLWSGANDNDTEFYMNGAHVSEVTRDGNVYAALGRAVHTAYAKTPFIKPVIHLGFETAMSLQLSLQNLGLPFVVAPGYPQDAIAVTGPIRVRLGTLEITKSVNPKNNRMQVEGTQFAKIEFDPYMAVRVIGSTGS